MKATYQRTQNIPLDELTPYPGNAKRGNIDAISSSIRRNGQYRSLIVREIENGPIIVLAGNHTLQALQAGGHDTARCEIIHCDDATARRINLADNRTADLGTYDNDALAELLSYLDDDYEGSGYTHHDVEALITPAASTADPVDTADALADTQDTYREQYGVIVVCSDEPDQAETYEKLAGLGYNCRVVTT